MTIKQLVVTVPILILLTHIQPLSAEQPTVPGEAVALQGQVSSWEKPAAHAVAPDSNSKTSNVIATGELAGGETIEITELKRTSGDTVTLKFALTNTGSEELPLSTLGDGDRYNWNLTRIYLLDLPNKKKYFILRDSEKQPLCSQ